MKPPRHDLGALLRSAPTDPLTALCWPGDRLGDALEALGQQAGLCGSLDEPLVLPAAPGQGAAEHLARWVEWGASRLGMQAEAVDSPVAGVPQLLQQAGPALLQLPGPGGPRFLLLLGRAPRWPGREAKLRVLAPDLRVRTCPAALLRQTLCEPAEAPLAPAVERVLQAAGIAPARRAPVRQALLQERLASRREAIGWILRAPPGAPAGKQVVQAGLPRLLARLLGLMAAGYACEILGWRLMGAAALDGRMDTGWMTAWALLLATLVGLQWMAGRQAAGLSLHGSRLLRQRLLSGALALDLDSVRHLGAGRWLGRVMESQALESMALDGGLSVAVAGVELLFAAGILAAGAAGPAHLSLLLAWVLGLVVMGGRLGRRLAHWTLQRLALSHALVERMGGHRTRLAQEAPQRRQATEDAEMQAYLASSRAMDRALVPVVAGAPAAWLLAGLAVLAPALAAGSSTPARLAVSLGGLLFAHRALGALSGGLASLARAGIAWREVAALFHAGAAAPADAAPAGWPPVQTPSAPVAGEPSLARAPASELPATPGAPGHTPHSAPAAPLVDATQLVFAHRAGGRPVLDGVDLVVQPGERLLLQGSSGGGKSTLAALLTGLRQPQSGLLLLNGLDAATLGSTWRRLAAEAPQFHDNHVLAGSLAFNLLMGRDGQADEAALAEAQALCEALGLGELLARMPLGLAQPLGETGWQLSHGERSRLFLARALLQRAPLTLLDESFAALDPQTLRQCLDCALRHSSTLVVIAHP